MVMTTQERLRYEIDRRKAKGKPTAGFQKKLKALGAQPPVSADPGGVTPPAGVPPVAAVPGMEGTPGVLESSQSKLQDAGMGTAFNPTLTPTSTTGDLQADRARIEEEVFGRLTRDLDKNKARDRQELEQSLYNRGIGVGNPLYNQQMSEFDQKYNDMTTDARQRAAEIGGQELDRSFGIGWQQRQNEYGEQSGIRNQNLKEIQDVNTMSLDTFKTLFGIKNEQEALQLQKYIANQQKKTQLQIANINANARNSGGGGGQPADDGIGFP